MATAAWRRFRGLVLADEELARRLAEIGEWEAFRSEALRLARELDVPLSADDLDGARRAARASWQGRWAST